MDKIIHYKKNTLDRAFDAPKFMKLQNANPHLNSDFALADFAKISNSPSSGSGTLYLYIKIEI